MSNCNKYCHCNDGSKDFLDRKINEDLQNKINEDLQNSLPQRKIDDQENWHEILDQAIALSKQNHLSVVASFVQLAMTSDLAKKDTLEKFRRIAKQDLLNQLQDKSYH